MEVNHGIIIIDAWPIQKLDSKTSWNCAYPIIIIRYQLLIYPPW